MAEPHRRAQAVGGGVMEARDEPRPRAGAARDQKLPHRRLRARVERAADELLDGRRGFFFGRGGGRRDPVPRPLEAHPMPVRNKGACRRVQIPRAPRPGPQRLDARRFAQVKDQREVRGPARAVHRVKEEIYC
jgi:hypothetical protein